MSTQGNKNFFYIDVEPELVIRNLIFFVIFCLLVSVFINYCLWPVIEEYKQQHIEEKKIKIVFLKAKSDFESHFNALKKTKTLNQKSLNIMSSALDGTQLKHDLDQYFTQVNIVKQLFQADNGESFSIDTYFVRGEIKDIVMMNRFFSELQNAPASIKVLLPIIVKKSDTSSSLVVEFYVNIQKSNYHPQISL
ncbi:hypothetical protein BKH46_03215 [Helicobacter sp. 12S02634-8]|uniref:hypothetical protein n=1 Tax=Helicobacter sp. 12S02634-8 TaxID=1476199 RepID=UPI000BA558AC|nr:hypothetical protein [Helicobacter sp. 12S02634-8]PAF47853.1 hypothetical protein BKH46_03215 [Helicobacter sp. 12S02634-8]